MGRILLDNQTAPATPVAGTSTLFFDSVTKKLHAIADDGVNRMVSVFGNSNIADVVANAADTYLTGSAVSIPPSLVRAGAQFRWRFTMTKTAAGVAGPIYSLRVGTNGTTADTQRATITGVAQTAATDTGWHEIHVLVRTVGVAGTIHVTGIMQHANTTTGLANQAQVQIIQGGPAAFDMTVANSIWGISCNPGGAGVWTFQHISVIAGNL